MFEVNVKNMMEGGRGGKEGRRGPAWVWGSDIHFCLKKTIWHSLSLSN